MDDNLENILSDVPWLKPEPITIDNAKIEPQVTDSKKPRFLQNTRNKAAKAAAILGMALASIICSTPVTPPPPPTEYSHAITIKNPVYMQDGFPAAGNYTVTANGIDYPGNFDQKLTLPKTRNKIELWKVVLNTTGLKRTYRTGEITDNTQLAPNVIRLPFPIESYRTNISTTGQNPMWANRDVNTTWNPNQGMIVDQTFRNAVMSVIYDPANPLNPNTFKMWSWIPNWPVNDQYFLKNINYTDGNHPYDSSTPSNGDIWVFPVIDMSGTSHLCYPIGGSNVMAFKLFIGQSASPGQLANETQVSFPDRQGIAGHPDLEYWSRLMFGRPNTPDYTLVSEAEGEFQDGFDARSLATPTNITSMLGSTVDIELINVINYEADEETKPSTPFSLISRPSYGGFGSADYTIPGRPLPVIKPGDKRAQENKRERY